MWLAEESLSISESDNAVVRKVKGAISGELNRRYKPNDVQTANTVPIVASFLDPRYKRLKFFSVEQRQVTKDCIDSKIDDLPLQNIAARNDDGLSPPEKRKRRPSAIDSLLSESPDKSCEEDQEVDSYLLDKVDCENPLKWWSTNEHKYPRLAIVARQVLSAPATSVPSERIFSCAGLIVTKLRNRLSPEIVDQIIFLNKNKCSSFSD